MLAWSRDWGTVDLALHLGGTLLWFWHDGGHWTEARAWLERALALNAAGLCTGCLGDVSKATFQSEASLPICRDLGDRRGMGRAFHGLGVLAGELGDVAGARFLIEERLSHAQAAGDRPFGGLALHNLGALAVHANDEDAARSPIEQSRLVWQELGRAESLSLAADGPGDLARANGRFAEAAACDRGCRALIGEAGPMGWRADGLPNLGHSAEALDLRRELGDRRGVAESVAGLACPIAQAQPHLMGRLFGAAAAAVEAMGSHLSRANLTDHDHALATARSRFGDSGFDVAWGQGRPLTLEQAVADASATDPTPPTG